MNIRVIALLLAVWVVVSGCEARSETDSADRRFQRVVAYRQACVARELVAQAEDNAQTLANLLDSMDPATDMYNVTSATFGFARAYHQHAELRARAYAYVDSALNRSATPTDSAEYIRQAATFTIRYPAEGTVEANVLNRYQADLAATLADADHQCNWDIPF